jgi:zinc/manganese transport system permease protein
MWAPFLACLVLVAILGYLGMHVLTRGIIFVDLALAQFAALGSTLAIFFELEPTHSLSWVLALGFTLVGALLFSLSRMRDLEVPQEAFIGVAWVVAGGGTILAVSSAPHGSEHIEATLVGSILWVTPLEVAKAAGVYALVGAFHWFYRRRFFAITFNADAARASGVRVRWWDFLFYASFGVVVSSAVHIAGVLLVFSFLIVPSVVGALFARGVGGRLVIGWLFGWIVSMLGCAISYSADLPTGATVVVAFGAALLIAVVLHRARASRTAV